jgi:hypothetical protein
MFSGGDGASVPAAAVDFLARVARAFAGVAEVRDGTSWTPDEIVSFASGHELWPNPLDISSGQHVYDSTRRLQKHYTQFGSIPSLSVNDDLLERVAGRLGRHVGNKVTVAVHLKSNCHLPGLSNAHLPSWKELFLFAQTYPVQFVLIGDDLGNHQFRDVPNVSVARDFSENIADDLAIIQLSDFFMGMMSGPANMALFGRKPYAIYKNPDHHKLEMLREIGSEDRYPFSSTCQRVFRTWDTSDSLQLSFQRCFDFLSS